MKGNRDLTQQMMAEPTRCWILFNSGAGACPNFTNRMDLVHEFTVSALLTLNTKNIFDFPNDRWIGSHRASVV